MISLLIAIIGVIPVTVIGWFVFVAYNNREGALKLSLEISKFFSISLFSTSALGLGFYLGKNISSQDQEKSLLIILLIWILFLFVLIFLAFYLPEIHKFNDKYEKDSQR